MHFLATRSRFILNMVAAGILFTSIYYLVIILHLVLALDVWNWACSMTVSLWGHHWRNRCFAMTELRIVMPDSQRVEILIDTLGISLDFWRWCPDLHGVHDFGRCARYGVRVAANISTLKTWHQRHSEIPKKASTMLPHCLQLFLCIPCLQHWNTVQTSSLPFEVREFWEGAQWFPDEWLSQSHNHKKILELLKFFHDQLVLVIPKLREVRVKPGQYLWMDPWRPSFLIFAIFDAKLLMCQARCPIEEVPCTLLCPAAFSSHFCFSQILMRCCPFVLSDFDYLPQVPLRIRPKAKTTFEWFI